MSDLPFDPYRPMGLSDIAEVTSPWLTHAQWRQWHRRGLLMAPRWTVDGRPVWSAADVSLMLDAFPLHFARDTDAAHRCGRTCHACTEGEAPETWSAHWSRLDALV